MRKLTRAQVKDMVELADQIVGEYPGWSSEHVQEMYECGDEQVSYSMDDLYAACVMHEANMNKVPTNDVEAAVALTVEEWMAKQANRSK